jgi:alpha-mannosidase
MYPGLRIWSERLIQALSFGSMLPSHHLLSQIPLRADTVTRRLQASLWKEAELLNVRATEARPELLSWTEALKQPLKKVEGPAHWGRLFDQRWGRVTFPRRTDGSQWLHWKEDSEATLYVQGRPYFGFDVGHRYCRLPAGLTEAWVECNCVQSAIWHPEARGLSARGSFFEGAFLVRRDDDAWHAWHDMKCLLDAALNLRQQENVSLLPVVAPGHTQAPVERHSPAYRRMLRWLDDACTAIESRGPAAGRKVLSEAYRELRSERSLMQATLTGHAHIDLVWLWPERIGELKAVHTFSTVNRLMDEYPEFRFAYSQPASYEAVQRRAPKLFAEVRSRLKSGRWQATGAMYVESDTLLACGEALFRSFLIGQEEFQKLAGRPSTLAWLPDVFGYSACLPQMITLAGADSFFTTKLTWNLVNRFPYSSFVWRGNDGSEVVAHVTQDGGYCATLEASELRNASWGHQQGDIHRELLLPTGYGDGGGGPTAEMCERARRIGGLPGMPAVAWDQPENFFARLRQLKDKLPVYQGECYVEGHRGTYTTQSDVKVAFRHLERTLQVAEAAACATRKARDLRATWKRLIFAQFHDYIPGTSVWDVYAEGLPELRALAENETRKTVMMLGQKSAAPCLFNPHAVAVTRWVKAPGTRKAVRVRLPALTGLGIQEARCEPGDPVSVEGLKVSHALCALQLDRHGWIKSLRWSGRTTKLAGPGGQLVSYVDQPSRFEAWDLDRHSLAMGTPCDAKPVITPFSEGHRGGFRVQRAIGAKSSATVEFALESGSPLVHVTIDVDWQDEYALLKFLLPTRHLAPQARFGIPYGSILRPQVTSGIHSEAMWEVPFSRWLAVFDERESDGIFAVTEAKYGATVRDGTVGLSLVRSPLIVGHDNHRAAWPPELSRRQPPSPHTDLGRHTTKLALGSYHPGLTRAEHPASLADTLFTAPVAYSGRPISAGLEELTGGETLVPAWAQALEGGRWLLRLHEVGGQPGDASIRAKEGWRVSLCTAQGAPQGRKQSALRVRFTPHQIVSVLFERKNG